MTKLKESQGTFEKSWQRVLADVRILLTTEPGRAEHWLTAAAALGAGEQWTACFQAAGRAVRLAPRQVAGWIFLFQAQVHLTSPAPTAAVLTEGVRLHGENEAVIAGVAALLHRLPPADEALAALAEALWEKKRALEVLRLAQHAQADLSELGLQAAMWIAHDGEAARCAARLLEKRPDHVGARCALLEIANKTGNFAAAVDLGFGLLGNTPPPLEQLLLARALLHEERFDEARMLLEVHIERRPALEPLATALELEPNAPHFPALALLLAAVERQRWGLALMAGDDLARLHPEPAALWDRLATYFDELGRPLEAATARVVAGVGI